MSYERITKKSHPKTWALLTRTLHNYRKRSATLHIQDDVSLTGRFWDGGSKTDWILTKNGTTQTVAPRNDFPFTTPDKDVDLTDGTIAISTGTFCGKSATASIYTHKPIDYVEEIDPMLGATVMDVGTHNKHIENYDIKDFKIDWRKHD